MRLRNRVNWASGFIVPFGLFALMCAIHLGTIVQGAELVAWVAGCLVFSGTAYVFLGRPFVELREDAVVVRNPLTRWVIPRHLISGVRRQASGFPTLTLQGGSVRLWALEESLLTEMLGGFEKIDRVAEHSAEQGTAPVAERRWQFWDPGLILIACCWAGYYVIATSGLVQ